MGWDQGAFDYRQPIIAVGISNCLFVFGGAVVSSHQASTGKINLHGYTNKIRNRRLVYTGDISRIVLSKYVIVAFEFYRIQNLIFLGACFYSRELLHLAV